MISQEDKEIDIIKLKFPDNVRLRPGKMVGPTANADVLLREIVDNGIDELFGCKSSSYVYIDENKDLSQYTVTDNGRGIPFTWDGEHGCTKMELAVASLDAGSKFSKDLNSVAVGMNGCGSAAVNALSKRFTIFSRVTKDKFNLVPEQFRSEIDESKIDQFYYLGFELGIKVSEGLICSNEISNEYGIKVHEGAMTIVTFIPDETIFTSIKAKMPTKNLIYVRFVAKEFYKKDALIKINGEEFTGEFVPFKYSFKKSINSIVNGVEKSIWIYYNFELSSDFSRDSSGSVNSLVVNEGIHIDFMHMAYRDALKKVYNINHGVIYQGLKVNSVIIAGEVDFHAQVKDKLTYLEGFKYDNVKESLIPEIVKIIKSESEVFDLHVQKLNELAESMTKISTMNKIKSMVVVASSEGSKVRSKMPACVADAASNDRMKCTLYICEGKSAGGNLMRARDSKYDAIFLMRGVPMNAINASLDDLLNNEEMGNLISAIGTGVNEYHDISSPRFGKLVIAADADADGGRIASLIAGVFAAKMTYLIEAGMVYVAQAPLYKQGNLYIFPDDDVNKLLDKSKRFTRYKGLGEMDPDELRDCVINPEVRRLKQLTIEGAYDALQLLTTTYHKKKLMIDSEIVTDPYGLGLYM